MSKEHFCLNCRHEISENFCPNCGQKTSVHRYSLKHFITHDLIHGIWHIDNGILFTIRTLFTRPGHGIREYIQGKRVKYFNFFTLLIIVLGLSHFIDVYSSIKTADLMPETSRGFMNTLESFTKEYPKATLAMTIPVYALCSFLWFKKARLNLTEHFVLNAYKTVAESLIALLFTIITIFYKSIPGLMFLYSLINIFMLLYAAWFYYQFFSAYGYSKKALLARSIYVVLTYLFFYILLGMIIGIIELMK